MHLTRAFAIILLLISIPGAAQDAQDAGSYLQFIGTQYQEITKDMMSYVSAAAHGKSARKVEKRRTEVIQQVKQSEQNVRKLKPFQKDSRLRDSVAGYFRLCYHVLTEDYGKILNMEDIAEQSYDLMEAYLLAKEKANQKLDEAGLRVGKEYEAFAASNNIRIIDSDSKLGEKMEAAAKVNAYYNQVYLIFFRSHKNEAYFMEALSRGDVSAMEQNISALKTSTTEDLKKIGPVQPFKGDGSLKASCQQLLAFYQKEATTYFPVMLEFQLKKENFEKMKKAFDAKRQDERTQQDADAFSKAVSEYNSWITKVNAAGNESNKSRATLMNNWNSRSNDFLDRHTPKYR